MNHEDNLNRSHNDMSDEGEQKHMMEGFVTAENQQQEGQEQVQEVYDRWHDGQDEHSWGIFKRTGELD